VLTRLRVFLFSALLLLPAPQARTQSSTPPITSPRQAFGAAIGDDYFLATYSQLEAYWKTLDAQSDRMQLVDIGRTEEGRTQWMAIVSAAENLTQLDRYRDISRRLALGEGLSDEQARTLADQGKAVVWIDGGLHANEVLGSQQLIELVYQLLIRSDADTRRVLRDVIVLVAHANPDGHELVANWYMRQRDPAQRSLSGIPRSYQKYVGHDNNRDFYLSSQAETINMNRVLYKEWFPQIVYDHHQTGPAGTVMFAPPFRDPFNYVLDPLTPVTIDLVGGAMHARFAAEGKPGVTMRTGSTYSTWWNGGLRTTAYFHNQIGLLTETIGSPTPTEIPFIAERQLPSADLPYPIAPQPWHFRQSIEYSMTANWAVLDFASRYRETLLLNAYRMARNAIQKGSQDTWTVSPSKLAAAKPAGRGDATRGSISLLRAPELRDPRGYILSADQPDFLTATKFVDALLKTGVTVHRATTAFVVGNRNYPVGSFIVKTAQPFRAHVLDMFEPQDHPDDVAFPGGPPTPPYDIAGWTLAFQMAVKFDRILERFDGPFEVVSAVTPPAGRVAGVPNPVGYLVAHQNDAFIVVNRLLKAGEDVYWPRDRRVSSGLATGAAGAGAMYIPAKPTTRAILQKAASDLGLSFNGVATAPPGDALKLRPVRIGLWDRYGGSSPSGWARWILERYEFPFEIAYVQRLDAGNLIGSYDVIVLTDEAVTSGVDASPPVDQLPPEYRATTGSLSRARTVPALKKFVEDGGTLLAVGGSTELAIALGLPVSSALETGPEKKPLSREQFYIPGSVLRVRVDNTTPLGFGFESDADAFFDRSPVFMLDAEAAAKNVRRVAWFASGSPLRSGWALGQRYLDGGVAVVDAPLGRGRVLLFGPEITFRAQSHGTFKFLFNGIYYGRAVASRLP
jgi:Zinc carboxypeptidase